MEQRFQVNLKGIIALLSDNLYSGPRVFVRELLQNAVDAIHARRLADPSFSQGRIDIEIIPGDLPTLVFQDNGIGLTEEETSRFLATIGESSKRDDLNKARNDFIGQFGIGLLSCFMVAEEIVVITRSIHATSAIQWRGRQNGTYSIRIVPSDMSPGTRVYLRAKPEAAEWCTPERVRELAGFFGALLPVPIHLQNAKSQIHINDQPPPWRCRYSSVEQSRRAMLDYGKDILQIDAFDVIPLRSSAGDIDGLAFILPYSPSPIARSQHRVYLKNILLSENAEGVLPQWAFFVRCIINANSLRPNAAREAFYEDAALQQARDQLGTCLRDYLVRLAAEDPERLTRLISLHYMAIKALAVHDDDFYRIFIDWIPFETSSGLVSFAEYRRENKIIRYVPTVDQFRQVAPVADSLKMSIINAGYTYDEQLFKKLSAAFPEITVEQVDASTLARSCDELSIAERNQAFNLLRTADRVLQPFRCSAEAVKFEPKELATLYNTSRDAGLYRAAEQSREIADSHWGDILGNVVSDRGMNYARLFLNFNNPMIRRLANLQDARLLQRSVEILYVQSLLLGRHSLSMRELDLLNTGVLGLIDNALGTEDAAP